MFRSLITGALTAATLTAGASAGSNTAYIVTRTDLVPHEPMTHRHVPIRGFTQIGYPQRDAVGLIQRPVLVPGATVSREVSQTPALPHLARVFYGTTTVLVDPEVDYLSEEPGGIDEGHSLVRAQRMWKALNARPARVIAGSPAAGRDESAALPQPRAILLKPNVLDRKPIPAPGLDDMPQVPKPAEESKRPRQVALAD